MIACISQFTEFTSSGPLAPYVLTWDEFLLRWFLSEDLCLPDNLFLWAYPVNWVVRFDQ